ncbi:MAG: Flp pilus assembly protein CpaB [Chloroflexi bacterium]|nr:Flp pilus assembly protein CpaB [Chloroflexota bacterium]
MRLGRLLIVLAIVVILGVVAAYALLNLNAAPQGQSQVPATTDVVMVVQPVTRGQVITAEMLGYLAYPTEQTISNLFTNIDQVVGQRSRFDIDPGTPLTNSMVVAFDADLAEVGSDTALLIPSGMVAFPIPIDRFSGLAYGLRAGDRVNLIASLLVTDLDQELQTRLPNDAALLSFDENGVPSVLIVPGGDAKPLQVEPLFNTPYFVVPPEIQRSRLVSQTVLQNITVLHVGNFFYTDAKGNEVENAYGGTITNADGETIQTVADPPDIITLIVTPQDAITLNYLIYAGSKLTLALRPSGDDSTVTTQAVTLEYLLTTYDIPVPSKLPYGLQPRTDILLTPTQQGILPEAPAQ